MYYPVLHGPRQLLIVMFFFLCFRILLVMEGMTNAIRLDAGLREGVYLYNGILTKPVIADKFGLLSRDINLLLAAL